MTALLLLQTLPLSTLAANTIPLSIAQQNNSATESVRQKSQLGSNQNFKENSSDQTQKAPNVNNNANLQNFLANARKSMLASTVVADIPGSAVQEKSLLSAQNVSGDITDILQPAAKTVAYGSETFADLQPYLPTQAAVKLTDGAQILLDVSWDEQAPVYDSSWPHKAIISGTVVLTADITNPNDLRVSMTVIENSIYSTPNGYADADFQSLYMFMSRFLIAAAEGAGPAYLAPDQWTGVTWTTQKQQGIDTKFVQSINLDGLASKTANNALEALNNLEAITALSCKNSSISYMGVYNCPQLTSIDCQNSGLNSLNIGECPQLATLNCANNALTIKRLPAKADLPASCAYTYAPQNPSTNSDDYQIEYLLDVNDLIEDSGEGYYFYIFSYDTDYYQQPYTVTWKDQAGNIIPSAPVMTNENESYFFLNAAAASGKTIHSEITHADFEGLTQTGESFTLPPYGLQIRSIHLTPGVGSIDCRIDYENHRVIISPDSSVTDFTQVAYTYKIASTSTASLAGSSELSGTLDITDDIQLTITDNNTNQSQPWTIGREQSEEDLITSFAIAEDPDAAIEIKSDMAVVYVGLSSKAISLTNLTPQIGTSAGASISPSSGLAQDFTNPVTYTVTSENEATKTWKVSVVYKDGECTCGKSKLTLPSQNIPMPLRTTDGFTHLPNVVLTADFTRDMSLERYPCFVSGHDGNVPSYSYRIGSTNECGAYFGQDDYGRDGIGLLNPGKFSLIATASLNGKTAATETVFEVLPATNNFKLLTPSFEVKKGDNITVKWNDDSLSGHPDKSYTIFYSVDLRYGSFAEALTTVTGTNEATFPFTKYQDGYICVRSDLDDGSYLICTAPVKVTYAKLSVDVNLPRLRDGNIGCFNNQDYVMDYKITGSDYAAIKDQVKLVAVLTRQGGPGESIPVDCEITDSQIIVHKEKYPEIDLSQGNPHFYLTVKFSNLDGSVVYDELASGYEFFVFKLPDWAVNAAVYDYKENPLDADHPLLLGPGYLDPAEITMANILKGDSEDNPILYACDFEVLDKGDVNPYVGATWDYQISDESVAEFYYQTSYGSDGTATKYPMGILAKKDGECNVTISDSFTGTVLTFPVRVSLLEDQLIWFRVMDGTKCYMPVSNFNYLIAETGAVVANPTVTYFAKSGVKRTVTGDAEGYVLIYDPDGITDQVDIRAAMPNQPLKLFRASTKLVMSTVFKSTAWGSNDWLVRDGASPRYQLVPMYIYDLETDLGMDLLLKPSEDLYRFQGLNYSNHFQASALQHMRAMVYVVNAAGVEIFAAPASVDNSYLKVEWNDAAKLALMDDASKVLVELTPLPDAPGTMEYEILGTSKQADGGANPTLATDGKTLKFTPNRFDQYQASAVPVKISVRATNKTTRESFDFYVCVHILNQIPPAGYLYPVTYVRETAYETFESGTYSYDLDTIFIRPMIQSTLFERTAAQLRQEGRRISGDTGVELLEEVPVNIGRKNGQENTVASVILQDQTGNRQEASSRTTPLGITPDKPMTMTAYIKSSAEDAINGNDYTIEAYKNNDLLAQEPGQAYYLGAGDTKMKYKWYLSTIKLDANLVPPKDYFKPKFKLNKADGSTQTVAAKFEAVNPEGLAPDPQPPANLPFTGSLSSGAFNTNSLGAINLPFELPANLGVQVEYDFSQGNLEGTFKMLVGYGKEGGSKSGDRFATDYSEAVSAIGNIRYGGSSVGGKFSAEFTVIGYVQGIVRYVDGNYKMIATGGGIVASAGFEYSWCHNAVVGFIPVYYGIDVGAHLSMDARIYAYNFDEGNAINGDFEMAFRTIVEIGGYIKISGGIGFDVGIVAAKIGAFGQLDLTYQIGILYASGDTSTGGKLEFKGTVGIEAIVKFLCFKKRYVFCDAGFTYTLKHGDQNVFNDYGPEGLSMQSMAVLPLSDYNPDGEPIGQYVLLDTGWETEDRSYLKNPQRWNGDQTMLTPMAAVDLGTITKNIQTNAYPYAYPILSGDNQIMLMLSDMGSTELDATSVVFSKKGTDGNWPNQEAIDPAETTAASNLSYQGNSIFGMAGWENVKISATDQISQMADQSEIKVALYNGSSWTSTAITDNVIPDMGPVVAVNGTRGVVLWQRTPGGYGDTDPMQGEASSELIMMTYNGGWSAESKLSIPALQVIKSYNVAMMSDGTVMVVYSFEKIGSISGDVTGREIARIIIAPDGTAGNIMRCTSDSNTDTNPMVVAKKLKINGVDNEYFYVAWYNEAASLDSQGNTVVTKDILLRVYDFSNTEVQFLPAALSANAVSDDPALSENFNFIRSESDNPEDFGISWLLPYSQDQTVSEYGVFAKLFAANGQRLMLTAPIKVALSNEGNIIDAFSTSVTRSGEGSTLNAVYAKTQYESDAAASTPEGVYTQGQTDLYSAATLVKNTIGIDKIDFDRNGIFMNAPTNVSFTVRNKGIKEIQSLTLSAGSQSFNVPVKILPNSSQMVSIQYLNGAAIISPEFSLTPVYTDASEGEIATATVNLAECDLEIVRIEKSNAGANGDYNFTVTVRNKSQYPMVPNGIKLELGIYEDVLRTTRATVQTETSELDLTNISDAQLDSGEMSYALSYHAEPTAYDQNGLKLLYITLHAEDANGKVLEELSFDTNDGIVEFTDPRTLFKEQFNMELAVAQSPADQRTVVTSTVENLYATDANARLLLKSTDVNGNTTESQNKLFTVSGSGSTDPMVSTFANFGKRVDHEFLLPEVLGFTMVKQDVAAGAPGKMILTAFGGSGSYEYSKDNALTWQTANVFDGLAGGSYNVCVRDQSSISNVSETESMVLYSDNSISSYTVSIGSLNGGSISANPTTAIEGSTINLTVTPEAGNQFKAGTLKYSDGINETLISGASFTMPAANVTVSGEFEAISPEACTITYDGNGNTGGSIPIDPNNYLNGTTVTVLINSGNLEKTGATFAGWNTKADGKGVDYAAGTATFSITANTVLYAKWNASGTIDECFIATAAFGSKYSWPVALLRHFRDQYLLTNAWGTAFVNFYYRHSPPLAAIIASSPSLRTLVRGLLAPTIAIVYLLHHPVLMAVILGIGIFLLGAWFKRRKNLQIE